MSTDNMPWSVSHNRNRSLRAKYEKIVINLDDNRVVRYQRKILYNKNTKKLTKQGVIKMSPRILSHHKTNTCTKVKRALTIKSTSTQTSGVEIVMRNQENGKWVGLVPNLEISSDTGKKNRERQIKSDSCINPSIDKKDKSIQCGDRFLFRQTSTQIQEIITKQILKIEPLDYYEFPLFVEDEIKSSMMKHSEMGNCCTVRLMRFFL